MFSDQRSSSIAKQALNFPVGLLISSPKRRLAKLGRKPSNGSVQSSSSDATTKSTESSGVRQPAKNRIRKHNNRLSTVFNRSPNLKDSRQSVVEPTAVHPSDDPAELSTQVSAPGVLKVFGSDICQGANYKSVLATPHSSAQELVKEALERYSLDKSDADSYVLCDVIGRTGEDHQWKTECFRVVGDNEKPLILQSLWKPKEGFARRFEIQKKSSVEEKVAKEKDTVTAGINAQARKLQKVRSRGASVFIAEDVNSNFTLWRSLSEMNLSVKSKDLQKDGTGRGEQEVACLSVEKEETESSEDNSAHYSIHPPSEFPYFLLLQGYSVRQDFIVYPMTGLMHIFGHCREPTSGEDEEHLKVDSMLHDPSILPQHCCVQRLASEVCCEGKRGGKQALNLVKPLHGGRVTHNGVPLKEETELLPGDLLGLGDYYLFMFKDPTVSRTKQRPVWLKAACSNLDKAVICKMCGAAFRDEPAWKRRAAHRKSAQRLQDCEGKDLLFVYDSTREEDVLKEIINMSDPNGDAPKLTPAYLLCLCMQHSATSFEICNFRRLLLRIASHVQTVMWEKTKELAGLHPEIKALADPDDLNLLTIQELIPGLQPLVFWMSNSIELLHFIQQEVPRLLLWDMDEEEEEEDEDDDEREDALGSQLSSTRSASEEAMTVLKEVIMFTFQQSVYYLTKTLYMALPGLLDSNPFSESGQLRIPEGVNKILLILKETLQLLNTYQVHTEIASQLFAYLFFFTNASLFNALMERGSGGGFYQWSRGVQIRANLDLLLDWIQGIGLGDLALDFFQKLSAAVNLLATPKENLLQAGWRSLRSEFASLNAAQLHHMLREYNPGRPCPASWSPTPEDADAATRTADILESFDDHPPIILPCSNFHTELGKAASETRLQEQISELEERLARWSRSPSVMTVLQTTQEEKLSATLERLPSQRPVSRKKSPAPQGRSPAASPNDLSACGAVLTQKLKNLELQCHLPGQADLLSYKRLALDSSCLLTPPNTPQEPTDGESEHPDGPLRGLASKEGAADNTVSQLNSAEKVQGDEEDEEVFTVELERGPHGLGLALVDGLKTQLNISGIYIKSLVPDSPAAKCKKLRQGDRILAVNGTSLVGLDYNIGRELIRASGDTLRLLIAKSESWVSSKIAATRC
ncbi:RA_Radil_like and Myo5p-like_CBD_Rasip1 domain-containing protein [Polypterus senegalus]|uniref:RA_Radil_like and Myo5p-like_CBD_Rasip1 domain-containing protein n=1 Tax=Polypterus senegalus TaxID=55291 RepID=UPI0019642E44|nr:RA_Radil_like and Myo5p-like_CBD_Rasip1 domain-containing protein [Polypterus senegalus]